MPIYLVTIVIFLILSVIVFFSIYALTSGKTSLEKRIEELEEETDKALRLRKPMLWWERTFGKVGGIIPLGVKEEGRYKRLLLAAGIRGEMLPVFIGTKVALSIGLLGAYPVFYGIPYGQGLRTVIVFSIIFGSVGFIIPSLWLRRMMKKRKLRIFEDLPDILDIMTVCVEAGLSIDSGMIRISEDSEFSKTPLAKEMKIAVGEIRAGKGRADALKDMAERTMEADLKMFVAMLVQTERLGTPLADSLTVHSDSLRIKRRQMAEEQAAKTSVKLIFPLVFLLFPAMFVIVLLPAIIKISRFLKTM